MQIPGASAIFRTNNLLGNLGRGAHPMPLLNITKSGVCVGAPKKYETGEYVCIDIHIPGEKRLRLYGNVKWINDESTDSVCVIGAQFSAYGNGRDYNSMKTLDRLRILHQKYGKS